MTTTQPQPVMPLQALQVLQHLQPGIVLLDGRGEAQWADDRALTLLGCRDAAALAAAWAAFRPRLQAAGLLPAPGISPSPAAAPSPAPAPITAGELPPAFAGGQPLLVAVVPAGHAAAGDPPGAIAALLLHDAELAAALASDLRAAAQMRSLAQVSPAVAHDLRAPINAMVLNLEVLRETLAARAAGAGPAASGRDPLERQRRYVNVLREELSRLHQSIELFIAHLSPRGDRLEVVDLREPARDLAAIMVPPARKQQARVEALLPDEPVPILGQRYQLRQALLHLGLGALERVPRGGMLEIRVDRPPGLPPRARLRLAAVAPPGGEPLATSAPQPPPAASATAAARLEAARAILADCGGVLLVGTGLVGTGLAGTGLAGTGLAGTGLAGTGLGPVFEIGLPLSSASDPD